MKDSCQRDCLGLNLQKVLVALWLPYNNKTKFLLFYRIYFLLFILFVLLWILKKIVYSEKLFYHVIVYQVLSYFGVVWMGFICRKNGKT